jgi:hypothetical protein
MRFAQHETEKRTLAMVFRANVWPHLSSSGAFELVGSDENFTPLMQHSRSSDFMVIARSARLAWAMLFVLAIGDIVQRHALLHHISGSLPPGTAPVATQETLTTLAVGYCVGLAASRLQLVAEGCNLSSALTGARLL